MPDPTCVFFRLNKFKDDRQQIFEAALEGESGEVVYPVPVSQFSFLPGAPFACWASDSLRAKFKELPALQPKFAEVKAGLCSGYDDRFVFQHWEFEPSSIGGDRRWTPFAKGGDYSRYDSDIELVIDWSERGESTLPYPGARVQNSAYYFREGLTYPMTSFKLGFRYMPAGCAFGHKGAAVFPSGESDLWYLLGVTNSDAFFLCLKLVAETRRWEVGHIQKLPVPHRKREGADRIMELSHRIHGLKASWDTGNEISTRFAKPWVLQAMERRPDWRTLGELLDYCLDWEERATTECLRLQDEIDEAVYQLYETSVYDRKLIERELGDRPTETVWPQIEGKTREQKRQEHVHRLVSYLVKTIVEADDDGIVPLVPCGEEPPLLDGVRAKLDEIFGADKGHQIESEINNELSGRQTMQTWLEKQYFKYYCQLYKRRSIYRHIVSEGGSFGVIVHYHRFNYDRLPKLRSHYLYTFTQRLHREIAQLRGDDSREARAQLAKLEQSIESARALDDKLRKIPEGDYPIHVPWKSDEQQPKGWNPDIDDGVKVNIQPFQEAGVLAVKKVVRWLLTQRREGAKRRRTHQSGSSWPTVNQSK